MIEHGRNGVGSRLYAALDALDREAQPPGVVLAVVQGDELAYCCCRGLADVERESAVTPTTMFRIGSVTKTFTALALIRLASDGALDLGDDVNSHITGFTVGDEERRWEPPTIWHLLTHTAGVLVPRWHGKSITLSSTTAVLGARDGASVPSFAEVCAPHLDAVFQPGSAYLYSNHGYGVLGSVIEHATGRSYETWMTEEILRPLGMVNSDWSATAPASDAPRATGYAPDGRPDPSADAPLLAPGCGAMYSNVADLARYARVVMRSRAEAVGVPRAAFDAMFVPAVDPAVSKTNYSVGLGWRLCRMGRQRRVVTMAGGLAGWAAELWLAPDDDVAVILLANTAITGTRMRVFRWQLPVFVLAHLLDEPFQALAPEPFDRSRITHAS